MQGLQRRPFPRGQPGSSAGCSRSTRSILHCPTGGAPPLLGRRFSTRCENSRSISLPVSSTGKELKTERHLTGTLGTLARLKKPKLDTDCWFLSDIHPLLLSSLVLLLYLFQLSSRPDRQRFQWGGWGMCRAFQSRLALKRFLKELKRYTKMLSLFHFSQRPYHIHSNTPTNEIAHVFKTATVMYPAAWSEEMVMLIKKVRAAVGPEHVGAGITLQPTEPFHCAPQPL